MWKLVIFSIALVAVGHALPSIDTLRRVINRNLDYLRRQDRCDSNCTYALAWGVAEFYIHEKDVGGRLEASTQRVVNELEPKFTYFIDKLLRENPNDRDIQLLYRPKYYPFTGDFRMIAGRIPRNPTALGQNLPQIVNATVGTNETARCYKQMMDTNGGSNTPRQCDLECQQKMTQTNLPSDISLDERLSYLTVSAFLNCTNVPAPQIMEFVKMDCVTIGRQAKTMFDRRREPYFDKIEALYLNKLLLCGTYGFPELYRDEYIDHLIRSVNQDGSVGTSRNTFAEKQVLTAQVASTLTSVLRVIWEYNKYC